MHQYSPARCLASKNFNLRVIYLRFAYQRRSVGSEINRSMSDGYLLVLFFASLTLVLKLRLEDSYRFFVGVKVRRRHTRSVVPTERAKRTKAQNIFLLLSYLVHNFGADTVWMVLLWLYPWLEECCRNIASKRA